LGLESKCLNVTMVPGASRIISNLNAGEDAKVTLRP
jgi:hypothetical protein